MRLTVQRSMIGTAAGLISQAVMADPCYCDYYQSAPFSPLIYSENTEADIFAALRITAGSASRTAASHSYSYSALVGTRATGVSDEENCNANPGTGLHTDAASGSVSGGGFDHTHAPAAVATSTSPEATGLAETSAAFFSGGNLARYGDNWDGSYKVWYDPTTESWNQRYTLAATPGGTDTFTYAFTTGGSGADFALDLNANITAVLATRSTSCGTPPTPAWTGILGQVTYIVTVDGGTPSVFTVGFTSRNATVTVSGPLPSPDEQVDSSTAYETILHQLANGTTQPWTASFGPNESHTITFTRNTAVSIDPCAIADFNFDGVVDFFDYADFVDLYSNEDPRADVNFDGEIDFFDYLDYLEAVENC